MIRGSKAEALEAKGLYRRAAARRAEVMMLVDGDYEREQEARRRAECLNLAARPPVRVECYGDLKAAVTRTHTGMGLHRPNGEAFRKPPKGRKAKPMHHSQKTTRTPCGH